MSGFLIPADRQRARANAIGRTGGLRARRTPANAGHRGYRDEPAVAVVIWGSALQAGLDQGGWAACRRCPPCRRQRFDHGRVTSTPITSRSRMQPPAACTVTVLQSLSQSSGRSRPVARSTDLFFRVQTARHGSQRRAGSRALRIRGGRRFRNGAGLRQRCRPRTPGCKGQGTRPKPGPLGCCG